MKSHAAGILIASLFLCSTIAFGQIKKYDIKSGIVTFDARVTIGSTILTSRNIVYFDDFGMKECKETYNGEKLSHVYFSDGKKLYNLSPSKKKAVMSGDAYNGTELRYDWVEASSKGEEERHAKKVANMTIAGRNCEAFRTTQKETICTFAGWNHILLFVEITGGASTSMTKAVKVEENVAVPPEKFVVPAGYSF